MPLFKYIAKDSTGKELRGVVEAVTDKEALQLLRRRRLFIVSLKSSTKRAFSLSLLNKKGRGRIRFSEIVNFTRQISTMVVAGLSLPDSLLILSKQTTNTSLARVLGEIERSVVSGGNLTSALSNYPDIFSPIYLALIRAGEASGTLDKVLTRLALTLESQREFRAKVRGAMIYPLIIFLGMILVVIIMMTVVIPKLTSMYEEFGLDLPLTTQILITISRFMVTWWWAFLILLIMGTVLFLKWKRTPVGKLAIDSAILKIPIFGDLIKKVMLVEFTRTFSMLTASGIHVLESLKMLKQALNNVLFQNSLEDIAIKVEKGFTLGDTFSAKEIFPPIVPQMIRVGEETGKLDETLMKLSEYFESESEHMVKGLTTAIEPVIMIFLGAGVGFIVLSVITPIYNLTSSFR